MNQSELAILHELLHDTIPAAVAELARRAGLTHDQAALAIESLAARGCQLDMHPQHGLRLRDTALTVWADYLESRHRDQLARRVLVYQETASTQDVAISLIRTATTPHDLHGTLILTDAQSAGRGRLGRRWSAPPGSAILATLILDASGRTVDQLMLAVCCALAATVEQAIGQPVQIKWPNDLHLHSRKLAGILIETTSDLALLGIGLNVSSPSHTLPPELRETVTSLADICPPPDRLRLLDDLLIHLTRTLAAREPADLHALKSFWSQRSLLLQQTITAQSNSHTYTGRVIDIDPAEGLLLALERGQVITLPAATTTIIDWQHENRNQ